MKQLNDKDIANMIGEDILIDDEAVKKSVRKSLHLSTRIPKPDVQISENTIIDFHNHTEEEAWQMLKHIATNKTRSATVITGASGILKSKFQQWATESILSPHIISFKPINNGSFFVRFRKN
ncbi:MAG: Smr/MutS family protein [Alphaproteobacteria bacterium]|nr:Smr/MutS family protein [Alphaproteobacteria bacterium]